MMEPIELSIAAANQNASEMGKDCTGSIDGSRDWVRLGDGPLAIIQKQAKEPAPPFNWAQLDRK